MVPVARQSLEDCQRMAAIFAQHHCGLQQAKAALIDVGAELSPHRL